MNRLICCYVHCIQTLKQLTLLYRLQSTAMARSLWKRLNRGVSSPWGKKSKSRFVEEKKTAT